MIVALHNYNNMAGLTEYWDTTDNKEAYEKNLSNPIGRQRLLELGYLDVPIEYKFNSHGFRTKEFSEKIDVVCFGCSFTMGTGVHGHQTWPEQLEKSTGLSVANLGQSGSSNDTVFRLALHYLPLIKPRYAVWLQTDMHRLEILDSDRKVTLNLLASDTTNPCAKDYFTKLWFGYNINQELNLKKNTLAFQQFCYNIGINHTVLPRSEIYPIMGEARDLQHPGQITYKNLADRVVQLL